MMRYTNPRLLTYLLTYLQVVATGSMLLHIGLSGLAVTQKYTAVANSVCVLQIVSVRSPGSEIKTRISFFILNHSVRLVKSGANEPVREKRPRLTAS